MQRFRITIGKGGGRAAPILLGLAMLMRLLVPAGWMPVETRTGGWAVAPCPGSGPMQAEMAGTMAHAMTGMHHGSEPQDHGANDHPCAFSSLAMALDEPVPIVLVLPKLVVGTWVASTGMAVSIGRGLAAPPPPSTGPPPA